MDLNRVMHIEQSVHNLLANPEANHLTKLQQKEWQAIEIALQHLMQNTNGDKHGGQKRPAPQQSSSGAGQAPAAAASQAAAPPQSTPSQSTPSQPPQQASTTAGVQAPAWAGSQGATGNAASSHGIEKKMSSGGDGSLDSMLYELEMAIKAAQDERDAAHHGKHGHHAHHAHQNMDGAQAYAISAPSGGSTSEKRAPSVQGPSRVRGDAGKAEPDLVLKMGDVVGYHTASYGPSLANNKQTINTALDNAGASPKEKALVLAMFMQETKHMDVSEGDRSKDGNRGGSANFSALNMNEAMLRGNGTPASPGLSTFDPAVNLNDQANVGKAAVLCLDGIRERGTGAWIAGQRGGAPAAQRYDDRGTAITGPGDHAYFSDFYTSVATDYAAILKDPALMTNDMRVENNARPQYG